MKNICNICEWEYNSEYQSNECVVKNDYNWEEVPKDFRKLIPRVKEET